MLPTPRSPRRGRSKPPPPDTRPLREILLLVAAAIAVIFGSVFLYRLLDARPGTGGIFSPEPAPRTTPAGGLGLSGVRFDAQTRVVTGRLRNRSTAPYDSLRVTFDVLDAERRVVEQVSAESVTLAPDSTWTFRIPVASPVVARLRFTGYRALRRDGTRLDVPMMRDI